MGFEKKLSTNDIISIKSMLMSGKYTQEFIANCFEVDASIISDIKNGKTYKKIGEDILLEAGEDFQAYMKETKQNKQLNKYAVIQVKEMYEEGFSQTEISELLGYPTYTISKILNGKTYND